jgi:cell division protease FtsH
LQEFPAEIPRSPIPNRWRLLPKRHVVVSAEPSRQRAVVRVSCSVRRFFPPASPVLFRRIASPNRMVGAFGRSGAQRYARGGAAVTFDDVAGIDEAKGGSRRSSTLRTLRYDRPGRVPAACFLEWPPGTDETLLALVVPGRMSRSSRLRLRFVEAVVGIGRVAGAQPSRKRRTPL